jgi:predicted peroxiredoxin
VDAKRAGKSLEELARRSAEAEAKEFRDAMAALLAVGPCAEVPTPEEAQLMERAAKEIERDGPRLNELMAQALDQGGHFWADVQPSANAQQEREPSGN